MPTVYFLFLDRGGHRVPVAGPYNTDSELQADMPRVDELLYEKDPWTHFDVRSRAEVSEPLVVSVLAQRIGVRFPAGLMGV